MPFIPKEEYEALGESYKRYQELLNGELVEFEKDRKRLEWLIEHTDFVMPWYSPANKGWCNGSKKVFNTPRAAIDAAIKEADDGA